MTTPHNINAQWRGRSFENPPHFVGGTKDFKFAIDATGTLWCTESNADSDLRGWDDMLWANEESVTDTLRQISEAFGWVAPGALAAELRRVQKVAKAHSDSIALTKEIADREILELRNTLKGCDGKGYVRLRRALFVRLHDVVEDGETVIYTDYGVAWVHGVVVLPSDNLDVVWTYSGPPTFAGNMPAREPLTLIPERKGVPIHIDNQAHAPVVALSLWLPGEGFLAVQMEVSAVQELVECLTSAYNKVVKAQDALDALR